MREKLQKALIILFSLFTALLLLGIYICITALFSLVIPEKSIVLIGLATSFSMMLPFTVYYLCIGKHIKPADRVPLKFNYVALSLSTYFMSYIANVILAFAGVELPHEEMFQYGLWGNLFMAVHAVVFAPLTEEFVFRKVMPIILKPLGRHMTAWISSLLFASLHAPASFFHALFFGLAFSYIAGARGIKTTIIMHAAFNLLSCILSLLEKVLPTNGYITFSVFYVIEVFLIGIMCTVYIIVKCFEVSHEQNT